MSAAVLTGREARRPTRPSWWRMIGAVLGGTIAALLASLLWLWPLEALNVLPEASQGPGHGWPWRIDGFWSLAADLGPLLLFGSVMALVVEAYTYGWTGVVPRRLPLVLVIAAVGWVPHGYGPTGVFEVSGLFAFIAVVWVAREYSVQERSPWRWTRTRALLTIAAVLASVAVTVCYGALHPLTVSGSSSEPNHLSVDLDNEGPLDARVLGVEVPGVPAISVSPENGYGRLIPFEGASLGRGETLDLHLTFPAPRCLERSLDSVRVVMRIAGRDARQDVPLDPPVPIRC